MKGPYSSGAVIALLIFLFAVGFIIVQYMTTPHFKPMSILLVIATGMIIPLVLYNWTVIVHPKRFKWVTGPYGSIQGSVNYAIPGPYFRVKVWMNKGVYENIPNKSSLKVVGTAAGGFMGMLTNTVLVEYTGSKNLLRNYGTQCELKEGEYLYMGSVSGFHIDSEADFYMRQIERLQYNNSYLYTVVENVRMQLDGMAKLTDKSAVNYANIFDKIGKTLSEAQRPLISQPQNQGGMSQDTIGGR